MKRFWGTICFFFILFSSLFCQQDIADSLAGELNKVSGREKVDIYNQLADIYNYINTGKAIDYAHKGLDLAGSIDYKKGMASSYGSLGYSYVTIDNRKAIEYTEKALSIRRKINDRIGVASSLNVLGVIYYTTGNYPVSIDYHLRAIRIREEMGDETQTCVSYNNIALVHMAISNFDEALRYLYKALEICSRLNDKQGTGIIYDNIGDIYSRQGNYKKAFECFNNSLKINRETGNLKSEGNSCFNTALLYRKLNDTTNALKYFRLSLDLYSRSDEKNGVANAENGVASIYKLKGNIAETIRHAAIAYDNALPSNNLENIALAADLLQYGYKQLGDYTKAYKYLSIFKDASDSLTSVDRIRRLTKNEYDFKLEKIKKEQEAELSRQNLFIQWLAVTLILSVIIVVLIIRGYTQNRKSNIRLHELNAQLKELNATKDRFFSIIAHDLRGPFQALLGISDILATEADTLSKEDIQSFSSVLRMSLQNQFELLNDLLDWSKLQNGSFNLRYETLNFRTELSDIMKSLELLASQKNITLSNCTGDSVAVTADRNMLQLVLRNIISNGIKFTARGGEVKVTAVNQDGQTVISIEDNGVGIAPEDIKKLFKIDSHHSTKGTANEMGTGLGLILCREIVEKHSGSIIVESERGKGSRFIISLPFREVLKEA